MPRQRLAGLLAVLAVLALFQGCISVLGSATQRISIAARPDDARVLVDGAYAGNAPVRVRLPRRGPHIVRIEKDGYRPVEIRLKGRKAWFFPALANLMWAPPILLATVNPDAQTRKQEFWNGAGLGLAVALPLTGLAIDLLSSKSTVVSPKRISVTLEKGDGRPGQAPIVVEVGRQAARRPRRINLVLDYN